MNIPTPSPTLEQSLACAKKHIQESLKISEAFLREMARHGESCFDITRIRFSLMAALGEIERSEDHCLTITANRETFHC